MPNLRDGERTGDLDSRCLQELTDRAGPEGSHGKSVSAMESYRSTLRNCYATVISLLHHLPSGSVPRSQGGRTPLQYQGPDLQTCSCNIPARTGLKSPFLW